MKEWRKCLEEALRQLEEAERLLVLDEGNKDTEWDDYHAAHNLTFDIRVVADSVWQGVVRKVDPVDD